MDQIQQRILKLPSFNDFSPTILQHDIRRPLTIVKSCSGNKAAAVAAFAKAFFKGNNNKRSSANVPATLTNTGLVAGDSFTLTPFGERVLAANTPTRAAQEFVRELLIERNGMLLVEAIRTLYKRKEQGSRKALLKRELESLGVHLSNATTDHTTLEAWFVEAGLVVEEGTLRKLDDSLLTQWVGVTSDDFVNLGGCDLGQRLFLEIVRRRQEVAGTDADLASSEIYDECLHTARAYFREDQLRADVVDPLTENGWIVSSFPKSGKGGTLRATPKLLAVPLKKFLPYFVQGIPADLRQHLSLPLSEVSALLHDPQSKNNRGLGLELLALRMLIELGIEPQGFRVRAPETGHAEVDLQAEGRKLLFSRWVVQCKNISGKVHLSDVAKEVGIAIHQKAHVVMVITTTDFTQDARDFAREVTHSTHLQFLLIPGTVVESFLQNKSGALLEFVMNNASAVMDLKRSQAQPGEQVTG